MAAPPPKPTALKLLAGNPGKRRLNHCEPEPGPSPRKVPAWLPAQAKQYWNDIRPMLEQINVMTEADETALAALCASYALWRESYEFLQKNGCTGIVNLTKIPP